MADDDMAVLLQEAISELKASRKQTEALVRQNQQLVEQNTELADRVKEIVDSNSQKGRKQCKPKVVVSVHTKNLIHSVYRNLAENGDCDRENLWKLDERFASQSNKGITRDIIREIQNEMPSIKEEEILGGCQVYFKSLCDDNKRRLSGDFTQHRMRQKRAGRLKHKLKIRQMGLNAAATSYAWSSMHSERIRKLMTVDYMSSESSAEESDNDGVTGVKRSVLKVKKLIWLRKKYRDAFHQIDTAFYQSHKRSRDKLKPRIPGGASARLPQTEHQFALKSEFRSQAEVDSDQDLNSTLSSETSPVDPE